MARRPRHAGAHPNGVIAIDHLVLLSPDLGRTVKSLAAIEGAAARERDGELGGQPIRQVFFRLGGHHRGGRLTDHGAEGPSNLWGITYVVADIDATAAFLGEHTTPVKDAVQPGRRITTLHHREFDMSVRTALISPPVRPLTRVAPRARRRSEYPRPMPDSSAAPVVIHTDGGCRPNPGPAAGAQVLRHREHVREMCGGEAETTSNNRMELTAPIMALEALTRPVSVHLYTDSTYVRSGITKWVVGWERNGWLTAAKQPVKNVDLWQRLRLACARHQVQWFWVKGHSGIADNELADELATRDYRRRWRSPGRCRCPRPAPRAPRPRAACPAAAPPTRVAQPAVGGPLAVAHLTDQLGAHIADALGVRPESLVSKGDSSVRSGASRSFSRARSFSEKPVPTRPANRRPASAGIPTSSAPIPLERPPSPVRQPPITTSWVFQFLS